MNAAYYFSTQFMNCTKTSNVPVGETPTGGENKIFVSHIAVGEKTNRGERI
jgi:hypothetical protein